MHTDKSFLTRSTNIQESFSYELYAQNENRRTIYLTLFVPVEPYILQCLFDVNIVGNTSCGIHHDLNDPLLQEDIKGRRLRLVGEGPSKGVLSRGFVRSASFCWKGKKG